MKSEDMDRIESKIRLRLRDGSDAKLSDVLLAVESECSMNFEDEIIWDFQKLIVSRARLRGMIFQSKSFQAVTLNFDRLIDAIRSYSGAQSGDRYLLASAYQDAARRWHTGFRSFVL